MSFVPLFAAWLGLFPTNQADAAAMHDPNIILDGEFEDWMTRPPVFVDPADAPTSFIDFGEVRTLHDGRFVHLQADFGKTVNAQGLEGTAMILLDVDGNHATGQLLHQLPGVDIIIDLSPLHRKWNKHEGVGLRSTTYQPDPNDPAKPALNPYDIGFAFAPTHAGRRFEFRFERGKRSSLPDTPPLFNGDHFNGKFVFIDPSGAVADETPAFTHKLSPIARLDVPDAPIDPLAKAEGAQLRIVSWNVHRAAMFTQPDVFRRVLLALNPDVLLFQEFTDRNSAEQLRMFLQTALENAGNTQWQVVFGQGGGDLRCAIAARAPLQASPTFELLPIPNQPDLTVRVAGGTAQFNDQRILLVSVHLKCCGRANGPEDEQRLLEVEQIRSAIQAALSESKPSALIISGDLNLVGGREPLEALASNLDFDKSPLAIPQTYQLDGLSNATWSDPDQPFIPGRLDYILVSDSSAKVIRGFVFDSRDLGPRWLEHHRLQPNDTAAASDHLPVVIDISLKID